MALRMDDIWMDRVVLVSGDITGYFKDHFYNLTLYRHTLNGVYLPGILTTKVEVLLVRFPLMQVDGEATRMEVNKSRSFDRFNLSFFKNFLDLLKKDVHVMFDQFF